MTSPRPAARTARRELGFDPGPEIAPVPGDGPQLRTEQQVVLGGQAYDGSPDYRPGRQHYFSGGNVGGQNVPGGWYSMPFWEPFMLGALLTGGFGGGFGGFGSGGHEQGHGGEVDSGGPGETGNDVGGGSGGGGGDWGGGSGGGDSGGGSGGGDWGGGSGDSGGGDSGGDW